MRLSEFAVDISIPGFGGITGKWEPDDREREAAWEMYVELVTRVAVVELPRGAGLIRESFASLYSLFDTTREILREYGPSVARSKSDSQLSFGSISISILNRAVRPVLAEWHPRLLDWEAQRPAHTTSAEHERAWKHGGEVRLELDALRGTLREYAVLLASVAGVDPLA